MKIINPVCGMEFEEEKAFAQREHEGRMFYFGSQERITKDTMHIAEPCAPYPESW